MAMPWKVHPDRCAARAAMRSACAWCWILSQQVNGQKLFHCADQHTVTALVIVCLITIAREILSCGDESGSALPPSNCFECELGWR